MNVITQDQQYHIIIVLDGAHFYYPVVLPGLNDTTHTHTHTHIKKTESSSFLVVSAIGQM